MSDFAPVSCSKGAGTAAVVAEDDDDDFLDEEPDYDFLGLTPEDDEDDFPDDVYDDVQKPVRNPDDEPPAFTQYILGTLLVRMVEARDVRPVSENGGNSAGGLVGSLLKKAGRRPGADNGSSKFSSSYSGAKGGGSFLDDATPPNPFARLQFLGQTQRTSQIYDTFDPAWPRNEEYYFDVTLPVPNLALNSGGGSKDGEKKFNAGIGKTKQQGRSRNFSPSSPSDGVTSRLPKCPRPTLSIWLLHSDEKRGGGGKKNVDPTSSKLGGGKMDKEKNPPSSSTPPVFLGMASIDIRGVLTGKTPTIDTWVPLTGDGDHYHDDDENNPVTGEVRIVCEYQPTDPPPRAGDTCRLTGFCRPADLFPVPPSQLFLVDRVRGPEDVLLSYTSPEGWICTLTVHRHMVICAERHQAALELYHDQILDVADRIAHSPLVGAVSDAVCRRLPEDGLITLGLESAGAAGEVLGRWLDGGFDAVVKDVVFATNWDGKHLPSNGATPRRRRRSSDEEGGGGSSGSSDDDDNNEDAFIRGSMGSKTDVEGPDEILKQQPLPGMPSCPITGQPMRDPVVAADGHTYERTAIVRWMKTSRTSPLTGNVLPHRELVPNYLLISSLSMRHDTEAMTRAAVTGTSPGLGVGGIASPEEDENGVDDARRSPVRIKQKLDEERLSLTPTPPVPSRDGGARRSRPTTARLDDAAPPLMSEFDDEALAEVDETVAFDEVEEMSLQLSPDGTDVSEEDNVNDGTAPNGAGDRGGDMQGSVPSSTLQKESEDVVAPPTDGSATFGLDNTASTEHHADGGADGDGTAHEDDDDGDDEDGGAEDGGSEPEDDSSSSRDTDYLSAALSPPGVGFGQQSEDVDKEI